MDVKQIRYSNETQEFQDIKGLEGYNPQIESGKVLWLDIKDADENGLLPLKDIFKVHPLLIEDCLHMPQRPKVEDYPEYIFVVINFIQLGKGEKIIQNQVSIFLGNGFLITIHKDDIKQLKSLENAIIEKKPAIVSGGPDILLYRILDALVDSYFPLVEKIDDELEKIDIEVLGNPDNNIMKRLHSSISKIQRIKKIMRPQREAMNQLNQMDKRLLRPETMMYLKDVYDHMVVIQDELDLHRENAQLILESYLAVISNKLNEIIRVLTVISTIFMPLTFIVGIYGMNFKTDAGPLNMPELGWQYGYLFIWLVMIAIGVGMLVYFKRKKWL